MTRGFAVLAVLALTSVAHADVVVEQYLGPRPVYADQVTNLLRSILSRDLAGNEVRPDQITSALHHVAQPGVTDSDLTAHALFDNLEIGVRDALGGSDFKAAATVLDAALAAAFANDGTYVAEPTARTRDHPRAGPTRHQPHPAR